MAGFCMNRGPREILLFYRHMCLRRLLVFAVKAVAVQWGLVYKVTMHDSYQEFFFVEKFSAILYTINGMERGCL